jgi:archaellum biogenesis protein FlaJ (TadC family)
MGEANLSFILSLALALAAIGFTVRLIHARLGLSKYKKDKAVYDLYAKATSTRRIVIASIIALGLTVNLIFQFRNTAKVVDDSTLVFDVVYTAAVLAISSVVAFLISKHVNPTKK